MSVIKKHYLILSFAHKIQYYIYFVSDINVTAQITASLRTCISRTVNEGIVTVEGISCS